MSPLRATPILSCSAALLLGTLIPRPWAETATDAEGPRSEAPTRGDSVDGVARDSPGQAPPDGSPKSPSQETETGGSESQGSESQGSGSTGPESSGPGLPADLAARVNGTPITLEDYKDYLLVLHGKRPLRELIARVLLEQEGARLGVTVSEEEIEAEVDRAMGTLGERLGHDPERIARQLEDFGHTVESYRRQLRENNRRSLLSRRIARHLRQVGEERIQSRFEELYGPDGIREQVRHVFLTRGRLRAELQRDGAQPAELTLEALDLELERRSELILEELRGGADFAVVAARHSHDASAVRTGGVLENYDYLRFGPQLAKAVRDAEVGVPVGPVVSGSGVHVLEVTARTRTEFEDARDGVEQELRDADGTLNEVLALEERLFGEAKIETF